MPGGPFRSEATGNSDEDKPRVTQTILATFDEQVIRPDEPIALSPDARIVITVTTEMETR